MLGGLTSLESVIGEGGGGDLGVSCGEGLWDQISLLSLFRLRTHTRHG